jgi:hypothetical protein
VCGPYIDRLVVCCIDPALRDAPTRKNERVLPIVVNHGKFKLVIKESRRNRLPHMSPKQRPLANIASQAKQVLGLDELPIAATIAARKSSPATRPELR